MIVKNEAHIIKKTLNNITKYINFDYWVICDTGSTDTTKEDIKTFFDKKGIPGELIETPWKDFGYNRTQALIHAYKKSDYVFVWDADDEIYGDFVLPTELNADLYKFIFGDNIHTYSRCQLFNNMKKWHYVGVLHEYPACLEPSSQPIDVKGNYFFISGRLGNRNKNPNKYLDDAIILEKAFNEAYEKNDPIHNRYCFYTAQSYLCCNNYKKAIEYYKKVLTLNNWDQEKYVSCLKIYDMYNHLKEEEVGLSYLVQSFKYNKTRIECIYRLIKYYCIQKMDEVAYSYYSLIKQYYETEFLHDNISNHLFANADEYNFYLPYYMIIVGERTKKYETIIKMYEIIFKKKFLDTNDWYINNLFFNIQFAIEHLPKDIKFLDSMLNYIKILREKNIIIDNKNNQTIDLIINKYRPLIASPTDYTIANVVSKKINIMLTITTCKRFNLFRETINSIKKMWTDLYKIDYFLCLDDNSSDEDREKMKKEFPFFNYYMKSSEEKGHRESMNIIWNKLNEIKPTYWIHLEDDWLFFKSYNYITQGVDLLEKYKEENIHQLAFNRNYGCNMNEMRIGGGKLLEPGVLLHEKKENVEGINCAYWPHYSLRPSIIRTSVILELGNYNSNNTFFERDYANKYYAKGYQTMFFDLIYCLNIGTPPGQKNAENAYFLNQVSQF
jgi:hypothetical protein